MSLWLDHKIFGNGNGMKSPYFDDVFYWLSGRLYTWIGGLGAQLRSTQWTHPKPGERRVLAGEEFVVFWSSRSWLRVEVTWKMVRLPENIAMANARIRQLRHTLNNL